MAIEKYLNSDPFSDAKNNGEFNARPGTYVPYDFTIMYPSGRMP